MICHRRRDSEAAGEASPAFHLARLVLLQASQSIPQPPLQNPFLLCCRAELAFSGAVSLQEGPGTGGVSHTHSAGCFETLTAGTGAALAPSVPLCTPGAAASLLHPEILPCTESSRTGQAKQAPTLKAHFTPKMLLRQLLRLTYCPHLCSHQSHQQSPSENLCIHRNIATKCSKPQCRTSRAVNRPRRLLPPHEMLNISQVSPAGMNRLLEPGAVNNQPTAPKKPYKSLKLFPFP